MHHTVPSFVAAADEDAQITGGQPLHVVVEGGVGSTSEQVQVRASDAPVCLDASVGKRSMDVIIDAFFARQERDAEVNEMVDLLEQHRLFLLAEAFQDARAGDVELDVAHHLTSLKAAVDKCDLAGSQRLRHPVRDPFLGQHQAGDKRGIGHAATRLRENFDAGRVGDLAVRAFFDHRSCRLDGKVCEMRLHGEVNFARQ